MDVKSYLDPDGESPFDDWFDDWFDDLNAQAAAKITTAVTRIEQGHRSNVEPVGGGVSEYKIDFGPGYRIYFAG